MNFPQTPQEVATYWDNFRRADLMPQYPNGGVFPMEIDEDDIYDMDTDEENSDKPCFNNYGNHITNPKDIKNYQSFTNHTVTNQSNHTVTNLTSTKSGSPRDQFQLVGNKYFSPVYDLRSAEEDWDKQRVKRQSEKNNTMSEIIALLKQERLKKVRDDYSSGKMSYENWQREEKTEYRYIYSDCVFCSSKLNNIVTVTKFGQIFKFVELRDDAHCIVYLFNICGHHPN
jgi:hypothetical protein